MELAYFFAAVGALASMGIVYNLVVMHRERRNSGA